MKKICIILTTMLLSMLLTGCQCEHEWAEAACDTPKTCTKCGETEGEALGHTWVEATCAEAKHCTLCGKAEGELLAHSWVDATCAEAKHCSVCGKTEGEPLEHTLTEANYQEAAKCTVCGAEVGEPLEAYFEKMGVEINVTELNKAYKYKSRDAYNRDVNCKLIISEYTTFSKDKTHEYLDGYEWKYVKMQFVTPESEGRYGGAYIRAYRYYEPPTHESTNATNASFQVNWNGNVYDCHAEFTKLSDQYGCMYDGKDSRIMEVEFTCHIPIGYDGEILAFYNKTPGLFAMEKAGRPTDEAILTAVDSLFFRLD